MADLSELLKEGTKEAHDRAENTQFVKDFLKGNIKKELFKVCSSVMDGFRLGGHSPMRKVPLELLQGRSKAFVTLYSFLMPGYSFHGLSGIT